ncbi:MAG: signal peptide peptidase SppA [Candidatus Kuenenia sp.]|nr:signal peptide peptidase SppA [Candidatus Kuenenia hertensis]
MKNNFYRIFSIFFLSCFILLVSGCSFISVSLGPVTGPLREKTVSGRGKDKILIVDISGIISDEKKTGFPALTGGVDMVARIKEELIHAKGDKDVKAVLLRINSPGGAVTASDMIYHEIMQFKKETNKIVVACIMDLGASGGYYVAASADKIIAHPTTVTGSIGVIMLNLSVEGLLQKVGITDTSIKTGEHKDMGSPLKMMTEEERKIFLEILNAMYERFLFVIEENRDGLSAEKIRALADGRIYSAQQALENGLIDRIGYLDDAISIAKKESGLEEARVILYHRPGDYKNNIYSQLGNSGIGAINLLNVDLKTFIHSGAPSFMYLWMP